MEAKELAKVNGGAVALQTSSEEYKLVKSISAKGATDTEFALLMHLSKQYGLDPLAKQIWCVKYGNNPAQIFTSRDGLLAVAHRSGQFNGMSKPEYEYDNEGTLVSCTISVYRKDMEHPFTSTVFMEEYGGGVNPLWKKMPRVMLLKVAESTALRKAFTVTGLYIPEEMDQAVTVEEKPSRLKKDTASDDMKAMLAAIEKAIPDLLKSEPERGAAVQTWFKAGKFSAASVKTAHDKLFPPIGEPLVVEDEAGGLFDE